MIEPPRQSLISKFGQHHHSAAKMRKSFGLIPQPLLQLSAKRAHRR